FANLNYEEKTSLMEISEAKTYEPDDLIIKHGNPDDTIYIILSGRAKITEYNENEVENQEEVVLAEMESGDFFGLTSLISKTNNIYQGDVKAIEPLVLISFPKDKIMNFFHKYHKSSVNLLLYFIEKLNEHLNIVAELYAESQIKSQDIQSAIKEDLD
ncbi:MAG: Crp/Fnr family transcriptional regulator, partial [Halanaerobium sp.]